MCGASLGLRHNRVNNRDWRIAAVSALSLFGADCVHAAPNSQNLREPSGAYTLRYPSTLKVDVPKGEGCANGTCRLIERIDLVGSEGSMTLAIQRDINPGRLAIKPWYESLIKRRLNPTTESVVAVSGRDAIQRKGLVPAETVRTVNGKEVSRSSTLQHDDSIFVPLGATDVLTIAVHAKNQSASAIFHRVIESLKVRSN